MSDIALTNMDIGISNFGDILLVDDDGDIIQTAINNIITVRGSNEFHPDIGNNVYNERHKISNNGLIEIANLCKDAILQDTRVANVTEVIVKNVSTRENYGICEISFVLITVYGSQLNSNITISI